MSNLDSVKQEVIDIVKKTYPAAVQDVVLKSYLNAPTANTIEYWQAILDTFQGNNPAPQKKEEPTAETEKKPAIAVKDNLPRRIGGTVTIDLSDANPKPAGDGWTFKDDIYFVMTQANIVFTGSNKGSARRIVVEPEARNVKITLDNAVIDMEKFDRKGKYPPCPIYINEKTEVTLILKGSNTLKTETQYESIKIDEKSELTIKGDGSLDASSGKLMVLRLRVVTLVSGLLNIHPTSEGDALTVNELTMYGGKINVFQNTSSKAITVNKSRYDGTGFLTVHGGEITVAPGEKIEKPKGFGIDCDNIIINGGTITVQGGHRGINTKNMVVNGGTVTVHAVDSAAAIGASYIKYDEKEAGIGLEVTVNGGTVTASVPRKLQGEFTLSAAAIGGNSTSKPDDHFKLIVNGGTVNASHLDFYYFDEDWKKTHVLVKTEFNGGTVIEGEKQIFSAPNKPCSVNPAQYKEKPEMSRTPTKEREGYAVIDGIEMMLVKAGTFMMGAGDDAERVDEDEKPAHSVTLTKDYYIGVYTVTQKQWTEIMGTNPSEFTGDNLPVVNVNYNIVIDFINKLNAKTGKQYRLPTEAEWEYAARGGQESLGFKYAGSNYINDVAWWKENSGRSSSDRSLKPVGTKVFNELGIYDMSGNVFEWTNDVENKYTAGAQTDPTGPEPKINDDGVCMDRRIMRGGSWDTTFESYCTVTYRTDERPERLEKNDYGFRLALTK